MIMTKEERIDESKRELRFRLHRVREELEDAEVAFENLLSLTEVKK